MTSLIRPSERLIRTRLPAKIVVTNGLSKLPFRYDVSGISVTRATISNDGLLPLAELFTEFTEREPRRGETGFKLRRLHHEVRRRR